MNTSILDDLLDSNLDDIADLPEFVTPPAGAYRATILGIEQKEIGTHPAFEAKFKLLETLELSDPNQAPVADGTETSLAFMMDNEFGQGNFKKFISPIAENSGVSSIREAIGAAKGAEVMIVSKVRKGKKGTNQEGNEYFDIVSLQVL